MRNDQPEHNTSEVRGSSTAAAQPIAWLRDAHEGQGDECLVPAAKGDPGAFPVYAEPAAADLLEALKGAVSTWRADGSENAQEIAIYEKCLAAINRAESGQ